LDFETVSLTDLDWILKCNYRIGLGFEKPKSVHIYHTAPNITAVARSKNINKSLNAFICALAALTRKNTEKTANTK